MRTHKKWLWLLCVITLIGSLLMTGCTVTFVQPEGTTEPVETEDTTEPVETEDTAEPVETEDTTEPAETEEITEPVETEDTTEPAEPEEDPGAASLVSLRQSMIGTPQLFAVACFGYSDEELTDVAGFMQAQAPELCENLPFLLSIPNVIGTSGELYCIVPADENATVAVNAGAWNAQELTFEYNEVLYRSESGDPILLLCNNTGWDPDTLVTITASDGTVVTWHPLRDNGKLIPQFNENDESVYLDFSPREAQGTTQINILDMVGNWELKWTEVEGDRREPEVSTCTLKIETDESGSFRISYTDKAFPEENFSNRELLTTTGELYPGCGNDQWFATVSQTSEDRIGHAVTLLEDGTLLMQHSWEMEGMPMVSYGWYQRVT